jgi:hypothetical protein
MSEQWFNRDPKHVVGNTLKGEKMSKTRIFVSSTCFDLSQVREDIRNCIVNLGYEPLLSEYPSFPVYPDLSTIENYNKNVRENTNLFF